MSKPREFWISESTGQGEDDHVFFDKKPKYWDVPLDCNKFHAIEYSAYTKLQAALDVAVMILNEVNQCDGCHHCSWQIARPALKRIEELLK